MVLTAALVVVQRALTALASRSRIAGRILKGDPNALVLGGEVQRDALRAQSLSAHDLEEALGLAGHNPTWNDVEEAWLERNGRISELGRRSKGERHGTNRHEPFA